MIDTNEPKIYTPFNEDSVINDSDLTDTGGMPKSLEDNFTKLRDQARKMRRKKTYQWNTTNESFRETHLELKNLGVQNNKFFLQLYDEDLLTINPYHPGLPFELQLKVMVECFINPWYYLRECARIPTVGKSTGVGGGVPFILDRNNVASWYLFLNGIDQYNSKPRQCGKTQNALAISSYCFLFGCIASTMAFANRTPELNIRNLAELKLQRDLLPEYMQMRTVIDTDGKVDSGVDNVKSILNPINGNRIILLPGANGAEKAKAVGRGFTTPIQLFDELDWINHIEEMLNSSVFAYKEASDNAKKSGALYGRIFMSTPGDLDSNSGKFATDFINDMLHWEESMFDEPINKLIQVVKSKAYNGIVFVEHHWQELRKSVAWYEERCASVTGSNRRITILREIELKRIRGSSLSPFEQEDIEYIVAQMKEPIEKYDISKTYSNILIYEELNNKTPYIISIDPSDGIGNDNNAFIMLNPYTQKVAAEFKSRFISQTNLCKLICEFIGKRCQSTAMVIIEANKGRQLIEMFQNTVHRHKLYYDVDKLGAKLVERNDEYGTPKALAEAATRRAMGFDTSARTRPQLFILLEDMVREEKEKLITKYVVDDICNLIKKPNGRIEAATKEHDDIVLCYLIAIYIWRNASNLQEFGLRRGMKLETEVSEEEKIQEFLLKAEEMAQYVPEEYKDMFTNFIQKDPLTESLKYYKQIQLEEVRQGIKSGDDNYSMENIVTEDQETMYNDAVDSEIFDLNFQGDDEVNVYDFL